MYCQRWERTKNGGYTHTNINQEPNNFLSLTMQIFNQNKTLFLNVGCHGAHYYVLAIDTKGYPSG